MVEVPCNLDVKQIQDLLAHRFPFLMVDKITELEPGKRAVGIKNVTINEWFFQGHFPDEPVMPGVMILECMAQVGGIAILSAPENKGLTGYLVGIEKARFRQPVVPGDQLVIYAEVTAIRTNICFVKAQVFVNDRLVSEANLTMALRIQGND
ncbi:MAG: 3-hydroxyacyl-ACP dehydratase FabZ [Armatimonadetes bacterium]|nr:3-hydroxyacyl-ACP dehydratase FabZ [Armatimonadota bacterium]MDW8028154.1 3-hydroxyacyl-ACP dehydratase FabZ [Armatimonadota bacterium]